MDSADDWKKRPMMAPITVRLQPGLHAQEIHIMHPLNAEISSEKDREEFVEREAAELAKQTNGDAYVYLFFFLATFFFSIHVNVVDSHRVCAAHSSRRS
jgi:hypothetical protein